MSVFIDLVYIVNVVLGGLCILSLSVLTGRILRLKKLLFLSFFWGCSIITLYMTEWLYYLWVMIVCVLFEKEHCLRNSVIFLFIHETYMNCLSGIYRIGHVLIITDRFDWFLPLLIGLIVLFVYLGLWFQMRKEALHQTLIHDVKIQINQEIITCRGFMDTGNQALYKGLPIVFLKSPSSSNLQDTTVQFLLGQKKVSGLEGTIFFKNQWIDCFVVMMDHMDVDADCLLNFYLI